MRSTDVALLVDEYKTLVAESNAKGDDDAQVSQLIGALTSTSDWTPAAATAIAELAQSYGVFVLRNALALAIALEIEDGSAGL